MAMSERLPILSARRRWRRGASAGRCRCSTAPPRTRICDDGTPASLSASATALARSSAVLKLARCDKGSELRGGGACPTMRKMPPAFCAAASRIRSRSRSLSAVDPSAKLAAATGVPAEAPRGALSPAPRAALGGGAAAGGAAAGMPGMRGGGGAGWTVSGAGMLRTAGGVSDASCGGASFSVAGREFGGRGRRRAGLRLAGRRRRRRGRRRDARRRRGRGGFGKRRDGGGGAAGAVAAGGSTAADGLGAAKVVGAGGAAGADATGEGAGSRRRAAPGPRPAAPRAAPRPSRPKARWSAAASARPRRARRRPAAGRARRRRRRRGRTEAELLVGVAGVSAVGDQPLLQRLALGRGEHPGRRRRDTGEVRVGLLAAGGEVLAVACVGAGVVLRGAGRVAVPLDGLSEEQAARLRPQARPKRRAAVATFTRSIPVQQESHSWDAGAVIRLLPSGRQQHRAQDGFPGRAPPTGRSEGDEMNEDEAKETKLPDPVELSRSMARDRRAQPAARRRIPARHDRRAARASGMADPLNIGSAFFEMTARHDGRPGQLVQAQLSLWQDYMTLWQRTAQRFLGGEPEPVVEAAPRRPPLQGRGLEREHALRLHQAELSADRALAADRRSSEVEGSTTRPREGRFLYAPVRRRDGAVEFRADQSRGAARDASRPAARTWSRACSNLLDDLERGKGQLAIRMTDIDAFKVGENIAVDARQGRLPERPDAAHPVRADDRDRCSGGRC